MTKRQLSSKPKCIAALAHHVTKGDRRVAAETRLLEATPRTCGHMHNEVGALRCSRLWATQS